MALNKIGINLSAIGNLTAPDFNLSTTPSGFLDDIPARANAITSGYFGLIALGGLFAYLFYVLRDQTEFGRFKFSNIRALGVASGIVSTIGMVGLNIGYFVNYWHIVIFMSVCMLSTIWIAKEES